MPQVELKYSNDLTLEVEGIFKKIELVINQMDDSAGICKSRAFSVSQYLHSHVLLTVMLLQKPHRDKGFMAALLKQLELVLGDAVPNHCRYAVELSFSSDYYVTH